MFDFLKDPSPGRRKKKRGNLEFDFITGPAPRPAGAKKNPASPPVEDEPAPTPAPPPEPVAVEPEPQPEPPVREPEPPPMNSPFNEPAPIRVAESIRRQKKEQNAIGTMLNGVVIAIICAVLLVTALAGTGGYVLWKQIRGQSATIALLESNTNARLAELRQTLAAENKQLADRLDFANQQLADLGKQLADQQTRAGELQKRVDELQRARTQMQRRIDAQDIAIERVRARQIQFVR